MRDTGDAGPPAVRRLQELGQKAAERATPSDADVQRAFDRAVAAVGMESLREYLDVVQADSGGAIRLAGTEEEFEFYRDPANQEPQGPPVRRVRTRPFSELSDELRRRLAARDAERERIWAAIQSWTEMTHRLDDDGQPVPVEGLEHRPLAPFFDELRAMVFPDKPRLYVCPDHTATHGYESCYECGGWQEGDPNFGRQCTEAVDS